MCSDALTVQPRPSHAGRERGERVVELVPRHGLGSSPVAQLVRRFTRESRARRRFRPDAARQVERQDGPLPAGVGQRDQVAGQVAAVDRGDIGRIERAQIARVVPIVEMAAEAREVAHGGERRLQPLGRLGGSHPTEIAGRRRGEEIQAEIGRRGPVGEDRDRVLLEIVRRQHVVGRRHEGLEEPPGSPRDQPQGLGVDGRCGHPAGDPGGRLVQRAIAGEAIQRAASGTASGHVLPCPDSRATSTASNTEDDPAGHRGDRSRGDRAADRSSPAPPEPIRADAGG